MAMPFAAGVILTSRPEILERAFSASEDFELAVPPMLPIITFRLRSAGLSSQQLASHHESVVEEVTRDGGRWISETTVRGQSVLRMMVISYLTEERHLQGLETALTNAAKQLRCREKKRA
jgi:glutamate/tyrosine decarboxylase-like PLP-dependent enzyme